MKLIIQTQYRENYGAHAWNGEGECPQYWKNKGGNTYVVEGVEANKANEFPAIVEKAIKFFDCVYCDNHSEEFLIDWSVEENETVLWDEWETPKVVQLAELFEAK